MAKCPNCGRETARTEDRCCQWCGYPLLSGFYKKIKKTYRQLKEERLAQQPVVEEAEPAPALKPELEPAAIEITVEELLSAYEAEGIAADAKFVNKILKVTGVVNRREVKDSLDIDYITLTNADKKLLQSVRCTFDKKYRPELNRLKTGQRVTVQGKYDGSMIDISLRDCVLVG